MAKIKVQCTFMVEVEIPEDIDARFMIEDNGCPGTGIIGQAVDAAIRHGEETSTCWACALQGENKIVGGIAG